MITPGHDRLESMLTDSGYQPTRLADAPLVGDVHHYAVDSEKGGLAALLLYGRLLSLRTIVVNARGARRALCELAVEDVIDVAIRPTQKVDHAGFACFGLKGSAAMRVDYNGRVATVATGITEPPSETVLVTASHVSPGFQITFAAGQAAALGATIYHRR